MLSYYVLNLFAEILFLSYWIPLPSSYQHVYVLKQCATNEKEVTDICQVSTITATVLGSVFPNHMHIEKCDKIILWYQIIQPPASSLPMLKVFLGTSQSRPEHQCIMHENFLSYCWKRALTGLSRPGSFMIAEGRNLKVCFYLKWRWYVVTVFWDMWVTSLPASTPFGSGRIHHKHRITRINNGYYYQQFIFFPFYN